jgi:hypothetical protein
MRIYSLFLTVSRIPYLEKLLFFKVREKLKYSQINKRLGSFLLDLPYAKCYRESTQLKSKNTRQKFEAIGRN